MSEPFVISDTSSEPVQGTHDSYSTSEHNVYDTHDTLENNTGQESYKTIQEISPKRMNLYMQQFTSNNETCSRTSTAKYTQKRNGRNGFKRKKFKKKRIKTLGVSSNNPSTSNNPTTCTSSNDRVYNYYNDDPGIRDSDFNMQWEGISRIGLNTKME